MKLKKDERKCPRSRLAEMVIEDAEESFLSTVAVTKDDVDGTVSDPIEAAFAYDLFAEDRPVRFGFGPEERAWLKRERSIDELIDFVDRKRLWYALSVCENNNAVDFSYFPTEGEFVERDGATYFVVRTGWNDSDEPVEIMMAETPFGADSDEKAGDSYFMIVRTKENGEEAFDVIAVKADGKSRFEATKEALAREFLRVAGVDSYHSLGRAINKGHALFKADEESRGPFPLS